MAYNHGGLKALKSKPSGGRKRENMTFTEEKACWRVFANAAGAGEMLNIHDLKAAYEKAIRHETSNRTIYNPCLSGCHPQPLAVVFGHAHGRSPAWQSSVPTIAARVPATFP